MQKDGYLTTLGSRHLFGDDADDKRFLLTVASPAGEETGHQIEFWILTRTNQSWQDRQLTKNWTSPEWTLTWIFGT